MTRNKEKEQLPTDLSCDTALWQPMNDEAAESVKGGWFGQLVTVAHSPGFINNSTRFISIHRAMSQIRNRR